MEETGSAARCVRRMVHGHAAQVGALTESMQVSCAWQEKCWLYRAMQHMRCGEVWRCKTGGHLFHCSSSSFKGSVGDSMLAAIMKKAHRSSLMPALLGSVPLLGCILLVMSFLHHSIAPVSLVVPHGLRVPLPA